ncbi:MAG: AI-2E family transporter [Actinomycetaceae bacterium]|nr:AI-2E family transporter [Arcanobacterium sp.]MDD7505261.1 AI-2E family transporter [Actinomycetaceae bacterium]MDY6144024.1 AI-2E family transporter [Arcanobacterium sp.]
MVQGKKSIIARIKQIAPRESPLAEPASSGQQISETVEQNRGIDPTTSVYKDLELAPSHTDSLQVSPAIRTLASWSWRLLVIVAAATLLGWLAVKFSMLIIALLVAALIAVVAEPLVSFFKQKLNMPPAAAAAVTLIAILLVLGGLIGGSSTGIYQGFSALGDNITSGVNRIIEWLNATFPAFQDHIDSAWQQIQNTLKANSSTIMGGVMSVGSSLSSFLAGMVLAFFALFFFLKDGRHIWHWIVRIMPPHYRDSMNEAGIRGWIMLGNYTRTQAIVAFVDACGIAIFAAILKTPLSLVFPIAALVFLGAFIPIVGAFLSGGVAILVVLVNTGSPFMALMMLIGVLVVQQVEGHLLQPILQGNALNMHPLAIVLLVAGGSGVAGIVGALFTVPIAAAINVMALYLNGHDMYPYLNDAENRPGGKRKDFATYSQDYWQKFDSQIAQKLPPKEMRAAKRAAKKAAKAAKARG